jgi:hypothetical protein
VCKSRKNLKGIGNGNDLLNGKGIKDNEKKKR